MREGMKVPRRLPRNVWAVTLTSFLTDASTETLTGLLPFFLAGTLGAPPAAIGLIEGVADATASLVKLMSGRLSDLWRRRKPLAVAGYGLSTAAKALLLGARSWPGVLAIRFLERSGKGLRTAPRDALLADSTGSDNRGFSFGLHRAGDTAGAVVGLGLALAVTLALGPGQTLPEASFRLAIALSLVPATLAVLVLWALAREIRPTQAVPGPRSALGPIPADRTFRWFLLAALVFALGNSSDAFLLLRAQTLGLTIPQAIGALIVLNLVYAGLATSAGSLSDRLGRKAVLLGGWAIYAAAYLGLAQARQAWQLWPLIAVYGAYYAASEGVAKALVADLVPSGERGTAFGAYHAAVGLAALPASLAAGLAWQAFGPGAPFLLGAVLAGLAGVLLWRLPAPARQAVSRSSATG